MKKMKALLLIVLLIVTGGLLSCGKGAQGGRVTYSAEELQARLREKPFRPVRIE